MASATEFIDQCQALISNQAMRDIFLKAYELIKDPAGWCSHHRSCIRTYAQTPSGVPYSCDIPCRTGDERATCLNLEGAVAVACNGLGILPPFIMRILDQAVLDFLKSHKVQIPPEDVGAWNPYDAGWFAEHYGHEHSLELLKRLIEEV